MKKACFVSVHVVTADVAGTFPVEVGAVFLDAQFQPVGEFFANSPDFVPGDDDAGVLSEDDLAHCREHDDAMNAACEAFLDVNGMFAQLEAATLEACEPLPRLMMHSPHSNPTWDLVAGETFHPEAFDLATLQALLNNVPSPAPHTRALEQARNNAKWMQFATQRLVDAAAEGAVVAGWLFGFRAAAGAAFAAETWCADVEGDPEDPAVVIDNPVTYGFSEPIGLSTTEKEEVDAIVSSVVGLVRRRPSLIRRELLDERARAPAPTSTGEAVLRLLEASEQDENT